MHQNALTVRIIGFVGSTILTLAAFFIVVRPDFFHFDIPMAVLAIIILAVVQFILQSICFIHLWGEKGPKWNLVVFASTLSIIFIIIFFSIWIMGHLEHHYTM
jgi:cytochrome o ubiquinol oxidase subunit IV